MGPYGSFIRFDIQWSLHFKTTHRGHLEKSLVKNKKKKKHKKKTITVGGVAFPFQAMGSKLTFFPLCGQQFPRYEAIFEIAIFRHETFPLLHSVAGYLNQTSLSANSGNASTRLCNNDMHIYNIYMAYPVLISHYLLRLKVMQSQPHGQKPNDPGRLK